MPSTIPGILDMLNKNILNERMKKTNKEKFYSSRNKRTVRHVGKREPMREEKYLKVKYC